MSNRKNATDSWLGFSITMRERMFDRKVDITISKDRKVIKRLVSVDMHTAHTDGVSWIDNNINTLFPQMKTN